MSENSEKSKSISARKGSNVRASPEGEAGRRIEPPAVILRLVADHARMKGAAEQDYLDLIGALASDVGAADVIDYLAVIDVAEATFDILFLWKTRDHVIECMRQRRRDKLALNACQIASAQRSAAQWNRIGYRKYVEGIEDPETLDQKREAWLLIEGEPMPPTHVPPYNGVYSRSDIEKFALPADSPADDGEVFIASMDTLERIENMIHAAEKRRDKALDDVLTRRRKLGERLRECSSRVIDGTINHQESHQ